MSKIDISSENYTYNASDLGHIPTKVYIEIKKENANLEKMLDFYREKCTLTIEVKG